VTQCWHHEMHTSSDNKLAKSQLMLSVAATLPCFIGKLLQSFDRVSE